MNTVFCTILICCSPWYAETKLFQPFFVPEDVQTILNVAYSRLPPVKLGNDQRFGVGFRLGRNADFQMLLELGPQSETMPLGNSDNSLGKRESYPKKYWEKPKKATSKFVDYKKTKKPSHYKTTPPTVSTVTKVQKYSKQQKGNYKYTNSKKPNNFKSKPSIDKNQMKTTTYKSVVYNSQLRHSTNKLEIQDQNETLSHKLALQNKLDTSTKTSVIYKLKTSTKKPFNSTNNLVNNQADKTLNKSTTQVPTNKSVTNTTSSPVMKIQIKTSTNQQIINNRETMSTNKSITDNIEEHLSNKTENLIKSSTIKPVKTSRVKQVESNKYNTPESIFGMFINWLSGFNLI